MIGYPAASREDREYLWRRDLTRLFDLLRRVIDDDTRKRTSRLERTPQPTTKKEAA